MATSQQPASAGTDDGETKKTVRVIAYAEDDAFKSERAMANELDGNRDYYSRERRTNRTVELVYEDDDGNERTESVYTDLIRDALVESDIHSDVLDVRESVDVSRPYKYSPSTFASNLRKRLCGDLPAKLAGGVEKGFWSYKWQDEDAETKVQVRSDGIDYRRVLLHHSERNGRRKYETERKHLSAAFTIELGPDHIDNVSAWSEDVVGEYVKMLAHEDWVHKVRVADCTEQIERKGDCFDL